MELRYEELVKDHWERLNSKLRMFSEDAGPEFLDTWVPDEDHNRGLFGIFEAAASAKISDLSVTFNVETAKALNDAWLKEKIGVLGQVVFSKRAEGAAISVKFSQEKAGAKVLFESKAEIKKTAVLPKVSVKTDGTLKIPFIHEIHRSGIEAALKNICHENKTLETGAGLEILERTDQGVTLSVSVDKEGMVMAAAHRGAKEPAHRAILDKLCAVLENRSLQEGRDHGIIRVDHKLRDSKIKEPLPGLISSDNTSAAFKLPRDLIRQIFKDYLLRSQAKADWNFWDDPSAGAWSKLSKEEKMARTQEVLKRAAQDFGVDPSCVEVVDILGQSRVVLGYNPAVIKLDFASKMIKMEKILKDSLEPRLDLGLENLEDKNKRDSRTGRV